MARQKTSRNLIGLLLLIIAGAMLIYFSSTRPAPVEANAGESGSELSDVGPTGQPSATSVVGPGNSGGSSGTAVTSVLPSVPGPAVVAPAGTARPPVLPVAPSQVVAEADSLVAQNQLLPARRLLNEALISRQLTPPQAELVRQRLAAINQQVVFTPTIYNDDDHVAVHVIEPGQSLARVATQYRITAPLIARINSIANPDRIRAGQRVKVPLGPLHAAVYKRDFRLDVWIGQPYAPGSLYLKSFRVGLGADDSTPTGKWIVRPGGKLVSPEWTNPRVPGEVIRGGDPKNPLGTRWLALDGLDGNAVGQESYGIHGTIEPHTIGTMASMGCVRMLNEDVEVLYDMLREGQSTVHIFE